MPEVEGRSHHNICLRCLGRCFALQGHNLSNIERGDLFLSKRRKDLESIGIDLVDPSRCEICHDIFDKLNGFRDLALSELDDREFSSFLVGSTFPQEILEREKSVQALFGDQGESIKREFNRELGKLLFDSLQKEVSQSDPDIIFHFDAEYYNVGLQVRSLYIYGIYRKLRRDIPQTRWIHREGNGFSVEQIIGEPLKNATGCENYFLHGAGREDVDVMMLGNGREFVMEAVSPSKRSPDLQSVQAVVNSDQTGIEVSELSFASKEMIRELKARSNDKSYRVTISDPLGIDVDRLGDAVSNISGKVIYQRTPLRVSGRRSDLVRNRTIRDVKIEEITGNSVTLIVRAESGTYIKELVHGDGGRTNPSLSAIYGRPLLVEKLDVIWIHR